VLDVVALQSGASFLETGMFLDDGLVAGSWEMFMRIWILSRVGDCFDPILDPTPDRNPFRIEIQKVPIAIKNF
jgi:hypothetical protein